MSDLEKYFKNDKVNLFKLQKEAVNQAIYAMRFLVRGDPGVGKTLITVFLIKIWFSLNLIKKVFILTKNEVIEKYKEELIKYIPELEDKDFRIMEDNSDCDIFDTEAKIYICDYHQLKLIYFHYNGSKLESKATRKRTYINKLFPINKEWAVIYDEIQALKSVKSDVHKIAYKNLRTAVAKIATTGTPVEKIEEYYAVFRLLDESIIGMSFHIFMNTIAELREGTYNPLYYRESGIKKVRTKIDPFMIDIKKKDVTEMVPKTITDVEVDFTDDFKIEYNMEVSNLQTEEIMDGIYTRKNTATIIQPVYNKIKEISEYNPRFITFDSLLRRLIHSSKVIVWERAPSIMDKLSTYYKEKGIDNLVMHGKIDKYKRKDIIKEFNENPDYKIMFISYLIGAEAWEIPSRPDCCRTIFYSLPDRYINYTQCIDRIHRINSKAPVYVYRMILKDSIDEWARNLLDYKDKMNKGMISKRKYDEMAMNSYERFLGISKVTVLGN